MMSPKLLLARIKGAIAFVRRHHSPRVGWDCESSRNHRLADFAERLTADEVQAAAQRILDSLARDRGVGVSNEDAERLARAVLGTDVCRRCGGSGKALPMEPYPGYGDHESPPCPLCLGSKLSTRLLLPGEEPETDETA